jgi:hypothetical protein
MNPKAGPITVMLWKIPEKGQGQNHWSNLKVVEVRGHSADDDIFFAILM